MANKYYITSPIYYANDRPHIGHAYTSLACDVLARWHRLLADEVFFLTGTDEYGIKMARAAERAGMRTIDFADQVSKNFRSLSRSLNFSNDDFIRTTEERHHQSAQHLWSQLQQNGYIYRGKYEGWYAVSDESYYDQSELQRQPDGSWLAPSGSQVTWMEEESYFFKLSAFQDRLLQHYQDNANFVAPTTRANEVKSFVSRGLRDISISRSNFNWGVPVPQDPSGEEHGHVMYVWVDALANYISACGYPDANASRAKFWPAQLQMIGKDILRFHAVYWPAILMAAGLPLPHRIFAHGWWTNEGVKISKSRGNTIDPLAVIAEFGLDQIRYFLLRENSFGQDGDFSKKNLIKRINSELSNDLGNLATRVLAMLHKHFADGVPVPDQLRADESDLLKVAQALPERLTTIIDQQQFQVVLEEIFKQIRETNRYLDRAAPWRTIKTDHLRTGNILYIACSQLRCFAYLLMSFMPDACTELLSQLQQPTTNLTFQDLSKPMELRKAINAPKAIFPRFQVTSPE